MLRTYLPRTVGAFAGFAGLSSFFDFIELPFVSGHIGGWGSPEMTDGLERLASASRDVGDWAEATFAKIGELMSLGFPAYFGGATKAPFDILGDRLRGTRGVVTDLTAARTRSWQRASGWYRWPSISSSSAPGGCTLR